MIENSFNTTLFLIATILTAITFSFVWHYFYFSEKILNLWGLRVIVDWILSKNPEACKAGGMINQIFTLQKQEGLNYKNLTMWHILFQINDGYHFNLFFNKKLGNLQLHRSVLTMNYFNDLAELNKILKEDFKHLADNHYRKNATKGGSIYTYFRSHYARFHKSEKTYSSPIESEVKKLYSLHIITQFTLKENFCEFKLNPAVIRWFHRDYLGKKCSNFEKLTIKFLLPSIVLAIILYYTNILPIIFQAVLQILQIDFCKSEMISIYKDIFLNL